MRILIDARMYGLENSGIGRYLINLLDELKILDRDNEFTLLLRKKYFNELNIPKNWKKVLADFRHYTFSEQIFLPILIYKARPDITHFPHINYPILYLGKHIITVHDLTMQRQGSSATKLPLFLYYFKRLPFLFASWIGIKTAKALIVPSEQVKKDVMVYYKIDSKKIFVTYEGLAKTLTDSVPYKREKEILKRYGLINERYFFYVGNAYPHKNLEIVIKTIKKLNSQSKIRLLFVIGGSRDYFLERLNQLVEREEAQEFVKLLGFIQEEDLVTVYKNSIAFIYPSFAEGFGLQGLEAMRSGTVVLASDIPVFKEIYSDYAIYFKPKESSSITAAMNFILNLEEEKKRMFIKKSQKFIEKYSWEEMAKKTYKIYTSQVK